MAARRPVEKKGKKIVIVAVIVVIVVVATSIFLKIYRDEDFLSRAEVEAVIIGECFERSENNPAVLEGYRSGCIRKHLEGMITEDRRIVDAQNILDGIRKRGLMDISQCHNIAHALGKAAVKGGSLREALDSSVPFCDWGFVHGSFQAWFLMRGGKSIEDFSRLGGDACRSSSPVESNPIYRERCFHGLGHGLAEYSPKDIGSPLSACDSSSLSGDDLRSCYAGVFMQLARPNDESPEPYFYRKSEPLYPCNIVAEKYRMACYADVSHRAIAENMPYKDVISLCERIPGEDIKRNCISQIYGTIAYSPTSFDEKRDDCRKLPEAYVGNCFTVVARNLADNPQDFGVDAPSLFCNAGLSEVEKEVCETAVLNKR